MVARRAAAPIVALLLATATVARADPVALRFAYPGVPSSRLFTQIVTPWSEEVTQASAGTVDIKAFGGPSLGNYANIYDRTINGVVDFAFGLLGPISSQFPQSTVPTLPFETRNGSTGTMALWRLVANGTIAGEFAKTHPIGMVVFPNAGIHAHKTIKTMDDLRGMKVSVQSRVMAGCIERLGGAPITLAVTELYPSLQRGLVEAATIGWPATSTYKLAEVVNHHLVVPLGSEVAYMVMNKDLYARLPAPARAAIDAHVGDALAHKTGAMLDQIDEDESAAHRARPGQMLEDLAPDEAARWKERVAPVIDEWVKTTPDGAKVLSAYRTETRRIVAAQR